jgi:hypothetical protein
MPSFDVRSFFEFLVANVMLKNKNIIMNFFFYNNMMMCIKIFLFFIFS